MILYNFIIAASNLYGLRILFLKPSLELATFVLVAIFASVIYHLADKTHGLKGVSILNQYDEFFLLVDRIVANSVMIYVLYLLYIDFFRLNSSFDFSLIIPYVSNQLSLGNVIWIWAIVGIVLLPLSEVIGLFSRVGFVVCHSLWHFVAFQLLFLSVRFKLIFL